MSYCNEKSALSSSKSPAVLSSYVHQTNWQPERALFQNNMLPDKKDLLKEVIQIVISSNSEESKSFKDNRPLLMKFILLFQLVKLV